MSATVCFRLVCGNCYARAATDGACCCFSAPVLFVGSRVRVHVGFFYGSLIWERGFILTGSFFFFLVCSYNKFRPFTLSNSVRESRKARIIRPQKIESPRAHLHLLPFTLCSDNLSFGVALGCCCCRPFQAGAGSGWGGHRTAPILFAVPRQI